MSAERTAAETAVPSAVDTASARSTFASGRNVVVCATPAR
jgi:hypothetical protein